MDAPLLTDRTRVRRKADRGTHDRAVVDAILDEAFTCRVGFALDGRPWVVPTAYARVDDAVYLHGASGNHALRALAAGVEASIAVTIVDGLVPLPLPSPSRVRTGVHGALGTGARTRRSGLVGWALRLGASRP
jgi:hypothetical protein